MYDQHLCISILMRVFFFFDNFDGGDFDLLCSAQFDLVIYFSS
jgi:hypothetical protein